MEKRKTNELYQHSPHRFFVRIRSVPAGGEWMSNKQGLWLTLLMKSYKTLANKIPNVILTGNGN